MIDYKAVGKRIRYYRLKRGLTQEELAFMIQTSTSYLSNIERGVKKPSLGTLAKISEALGLSIEDLTGNPVLIDGNPPRDAGRPVYLCSEAEKNRLVHHLFEIISILEGSS